MDTVILVFVVLAFIQSQISLILSVLTFMKGRKFEEPQQWEFEEEEPEIRIPRKPDYREYEQDFQELIS